MKFYGYLFLFCLSFLILSCQKESFNVNGRYFPNEDRPEFNISSLSTLSVSTQTIKSGEAVIVTFQALDENNNPMTSQGVVSFLTEGTATGSFSQVVFDGNGNYTSVFTAKKIGTLNLKARVNPYKKGISIGSIPITVTLGDLSLTQSTITFSQTMLMVNETMSFVLTLKDVNGNIIDDPSLLINPTLLDGTSEGTFGSVNYISNGQYEGTLTGTVAGSPAHINLSIRRQGSVYSSQTVLVY